jgi:hypothetical protein
VKNFFNYLLLDLLPFWQEFFSLLSSISWPLVAFWFVFAFRKQFRVLILRIKKAGAGGVEFGDGEGQENIGPRPQFTVLKKESENILRSPALSVVEKPIRDDLPNFDHEKVVDHLVTALARERLDRIFSLAYANIFGSQIRLLRDVIGARGYTSKLEVEEFFIALKSGDEAFADWDLSRYLSFLYFFQLVADSDDRIQITDFGRDFLIFLARFNLSPERAH